jgi:hypothetical protein
MTSFVLCGLVLRLASIRHKLIQSYRHLLVIILLPGYTGLQIVQDQICM